MKFVFMLLFFGFSASVFADDDERQDSRRQLREFFQQSYHALSRSMGLTESGTFGKTGETQVQKSSPWLLSGVSVRVRPKAGVTIPGVGSLKLVPELELSWDL